MADRGHLALDDQAFDRHRNLLCGKLQRARSAQPHHA